MKFKKVLKFFPIAFTLALLMALIPVAPVFALAEVYCTPTSGSPGTPVTVYAGTFVTPTGTGTLSFDGAVQGTGTVTTGIFSGAFTVPNKPRGTYVVSVTVGAETVQANFNIVSKITLSSSSGNVGDSVTVTGNGFSAGTVVFYFDDTPTTFTSSADLTGTLTSTAITIPAATKAIHSIKAVDATGLVNAASASYSVNSKIILTPITGGSGDTVSIAGTGFSGTSPISLTFDGIARATTPAAVTTGTTGGFSATFTVPATSRGAKTVIASDAASNAASATFTVGQKITLSATTGFTGDEITIAGQSFASNRAVSFYIDPTSTSDGTPVIVSPAVTTDSSGNFSGVIFKIPGVVGGTHTIKVKDADNNEASATITVGRKITLSAASGFVGDEITITGTGFAASKAITFESGGLIGTSALNTDASGLFTVKVTIRPVTGGSYSIKAKDADNNEASAIFAVGAKIAISKATGPVGTSVTVSGSGFVATPNVSITYDGTEKGTSAVLADGSLATPVTFAIPASVKGAHIIRAVQSSTQISATFTVTISMSLDKTSGVYGDIITVSGSGFAAESNVVMGFQSGATEYALVPISGSATTSSGGSFSATFSVLLVPAGNWNVKAYNADASVAATAPLSVKSKINITPTTGAAGAKLTVTGYGFAATRPITMKYNGEVQVINALNSDANGYFATSFNVPASAAGTFAVEASDGGNSAKVDFIAVAGASISSVTTEAAPGNVGMEVTISGTGFKPSTAIVITFESTPVQVASVTSSDEGSFTAIFKIPAAVKGAHSIKATDGTTTKTFPFFVEGTPPAKPNLAVPTDKFKPKQPVPFSWYGVTDPSGVTYEYQLSLDPTFKTVLLSKTGLTGNSYTLSSADSITVNGKTYVEGKLPSAGSKTPYNWRVRAVDGAGNASEWSAANTFTIGLILPGWMIHVWYGLGIVVALILGLWAGRRMAYQSY